jgi:3'5'-cyclic nucleotide phosphodiesterase
VNYFLRVESSIESTHKPKDLIGLQACRFTISRDLLVHFLKVFSDTTRLRFWHTDTDDKKCEYELVFNIRLSSYTYGITSDPMTQFACVFAALIHDVDHAGVPNGQLQIENPILSEFYQNRSIAEQNSFDLAWNLLMDDEYRDLRESIYETEEDICHFRELVVNAVMATDILDSELKTLRNDRWNRAFPPTQRGNFRGVVARSSEPKSNNCSRAPYPSFRCRSHNATLARLSKMERALVHGDASGIHRRTVRSSTSQVLVSRGAGIFRFLRHSLGQETKGLRRFRCMFGSELCLEKSSRMGADWGSHRGKHDGCNTTLE